jgi:hypothetical protein
VSSTRFEYPSVHPQEDVYMQFMLFRSCILTSKKDVPDQALPSIDQTAYMDALKKCHKTVCTSLPEDEHLGCSKHVEDTKITSLM